MNERVVFPVCLLILITSSMVFLILDKKLEHVPSVFFSGLAAYFTFHAYLFTKEKFRLDLLEKRWEIYEKVLHFCSVVTHHGNLPPHSKNEADSDKNQQVIDAIIAAHNSFRGIGYHKSKSLFGDDIQDVFSKLNKSYSWLISYQNINLNSQEIQEKYQHINFIVDTVTNLPETFKPYVYFGDYRGVTK